MYPNLLESLSKHIALTPEEQELVCAAFKLRSVVKKECLLRPGQVFHHATFVRKGCFTMHTFDKNGKASVVQIAVEGWWVGDIYSFLTQKPSEYFVEAIESAEVLQIHHEKLEELYTRVPKMERYFRILVQNAYITFQNRVVSSMRQTAQERYMEFQQTRPGLEQRIPLYTIASYLGIRPEFLSRIRKRMAGR